MMLCNGCRVQRYCGPACQKRHWRTHKPVCKRRQAIRALIQILNEPFAAPDVRLKRSLAIAAPQALDDVLSTPTIRDLLEAVPSDLPIKYQGAGIHVSLHALSGILSVGLPTDTQPVDVDGSCLLQLQACKQFCKHGGPEIVLHKLVNAAAGEPDEELTGWLRNLSAMGMRNAVQETLAAFSPGDALPRCSNVPGS
jgi:hypothetical protein